MSRIKEISLFLAVLLFILNGCSTVTTSRIPMPQNASGEGGLAVLFYDNKGKMKESTLTSYQMLLALYSGKPGKEGARLVREGTGGSWLVDDLAPGKYYLEVGGWIDEHGKKNTSKSNLYPIEIQPNQTTEVNIVLTDYLKSSAAVGGAVLGTAAILVIGFSIALVLALVAAI